MIGHKTNERRLKVERLFIAHRQGDLKTKKVKEEKKKKVNQRKKLANIWSNRLRLDQSEYCVAFIGMKEKKKEKENKNKMEIKKEKKEKKATNENISILACNQYMCKEPGCGKSYQSQSSLYNHYRQKHPNAQV